ncbi:hypothetical protein CLOP_g1841 [Closterium sp. NIES-67]|nr:hypothetical protein CLOP_g1841 [Closterium sp. NIES-67]
MTSQHSQRTLLPKSWVPAYRLLRELLIQEVHDSNLSGHFGVDKTQKLLHRFYYWPDSTSDVQRYVSACPICQHMKSSRQRPAGLLQPLEPPQRPWQHVTMDFVTRLPTTATGNDAILVVVDRLTKMAHFAPCRTTITAEDTAKLLISTIVRLHGVPLAIISDRDPKFTSKFWQETWAQYGTRLQFSSAYHPQNDGETERTNKTMEQLIRTNCPDPARWEEFLPMLEFSYNKAPSATTTHSPFFLNYGMDPTVPTTTNIDNLTFFLTIFQTNYRHTNASTRDRGGTGFEADLPSTISAQAYGADRHEKTDRVSPSQRNYPTIHFGRTVPQYSSHRNRTEACACASTYRALNKQTIKINIRFRESMTCLTSFGELRYFLTGSVTPVTFRLRLPATWKIHNAFHVQLLKPYRDPNTIFVGRQPPPPPPVLVQNEPEYEVESVLAHRRRRNGTVELLNRWKGYDPSEDSWVPESDMGNARRPLHDYLVKQGVTSTTQL